MPKSSSRNPDQAQLPEEAETRRNFWRALWATIGVALVCAFLVQQTEWCMSLSGPPGGEEKLRQSMADDREAQKQMGERYSVEKKEAPVAGLKFHDLFSDADEAMLKRAKRSLLEDKTFETEFKRKYGVSLEDVNALAVPAWYVTNDYNQVLFGLTASGWKEAKRRAGSLWIKGFTIRDGFKNGKRAREVTVDGTPRIFLEYKAFDSDAQLRQTLFHEMLHALNVPEHYECSFNFKRSDLVYLPEYREHLERAGMRNDDRWLWLAIYGLSILLFYNLLLVIFYTPWRAARSSLARLRRRIRPVGS